MHCGTFASHRARRRGAVAMRRGEENLYLKGKANTAAARTAPHGVAFVSHWPADGDVRAHTSFAVILAEALVWVI